MAAPCLCHLIVVLVLVLAVAAVQTSCFVHGSARHLQRGECWQVKQDRQYSATATVRPTMPSIMARATPDGAMSITSNRRSTACALATSSTKSSATAARQETLVVPLLWRDGGFCVQYKAKDVETTFLGVADTGSPFLLLGRCLRRDCDSYCPKWGCYGGEGKPTDLADTTEVYVSGQRSVEWRGGLDLVFPCADRAVVLPDLIFGVQGALQGTGGTGGGVYFGLIRDHSPDLRPSFLEQTPFKSIIFDLRRPGQESLTLDQRSLLDSGRVSSASNNVLKLLDTRCYGGPVRHYAAVASSVKVAGEPMSRRVLCIFDTGTTGLALTEGAFNAYFGTVRKKAAQGVRLADARKLDISFTLCSGRELKLSMHRGSHATYGAGLDLVTVVPEVAWTGMGDQESIAAYMAPAETGCPDSARTPLVGFDDVAFLGLGFLVGRKLTIDVEAGLLSLSDQPS